MRALFATYRLQLVSLFRVPVPIIGQLLLPTAFFVMFGLNVPEEDRLQVAIGFACFSVVTVVLSDFGMAIATERDAPWTAFDKTLPGSPLARIVGRVLSSLTYGSLGSIPLLAFGAASHDGPVLLPTIGTVVLLILGGVQFGALGFVIGSFVHERTANVTGGVAALGLAYFGGFFTTLDRLPQWLQTMAKAIPSRWYFELAGSSYSLHNHSFWFLIVINAAFTGVLVGAAVLVESGWKLKDYS